MPLSVVLTFGSVNFLIGKKKRRMRNNLGYFVQETDCSIREINAIMTETLT
jgi:hypothetical protein